MLSQITKLKIGFTARILLIVCTFIWNGCEAISTRSSFMPEAFWGTGDDRDLPRLFESVCVQDPKCGDTHFAIDGHHVNVHFTEYDSVEKARVRLEEAVKISVQIVGQASVFDDAGVQVGEKIVLKGHLDQGKLFYVLAWTRGTRFAYVTAESLDSIRVYEVDRNL